MAFSPTCSMVSVLPSTSGAASKAYQERWAKESSPSRKKSNCWSMRLKMRVPISTEWPLASGMPCPT